jgi:hypothetical protein
MILRFLRISRVRLRLFKRLASELFNSRRLKSETVGLRQLRISNSQISKIAAAAPFQERQPED